MKQVLSFEQMKHLKDLGVNTSDASMVLIATDDDGCTLLWEDAEKAIKHHLYDVYFNLYYVESSSYDHSFKKECGVLPCRIFSINLPCFIGNQVLTIQKLADRYTCLYMESYTKSMIKITESKELIDATYDMLCWCIENGYVKVGKEE